MNRYKDVCITKYAFRRTNEICPCNKRTTCVVVNAVDDDDDSRLYHHLVKLQNNITIL